MKTEQDSISATKAGVSDTSRLGSDRNGERYVIYILALALSFVVWLLAIRAPLWLDETVSFSQIHDGFFRIWARQGLAVPAYSHGLSFPAYSCILWLWTKVAGTSEVALRVPSLLAMLAAVFLLYRAALELLERESAFIAAIVFCVHPIIVFESIDARPYAFAALATNAAIFALVRMRNNHSNWLATLFGFSAACILWFQFLFAVILPAFVLCFFVIKRGEHRKTLQRQFGIALATFVLASLPVFPGIFYMFHNSGTHVFEEAPKLYAIFWTLAPGWLPVIFVGAAFVFLLVAASRTRTPEQRVHFAVWQILFCSSLALIPILILYGVSVETPLHIFVARYRLIAIPGIALCWAALVRMLNSRTVRLLFCTALVATTACLSLISSSARQHGYTWKYALDVAEKSASVDDAPVLICSDLPEADYVTMPLDSAKDSTLFAPLSYYQLSVPVVPLPRALNSEAMRVGSAFLQQAAQRQEHFLALANTPSYKTLDWLANTASGTHTDHKLGVFDGVEVLEFVPHHGKI